MSLSEKSIKEFQEIFKKKYGKELSYEEASAQAYNLMRFVETLYECAKEDFFRKEKLKDFPSGFHLDGAGYTCSICRNNVSREETWYDKYGIKCMTCQKAIDRKEIPASLSKNKDSWYSKYDMESRFNLKGPTLRRWIKDGILKARTVTNDGKGVHIQLFLIKDNKDTLPPKKLTDSLLVKEIIDGKNWYHSEPWYKFVNPQEHLKGYRIMDYLRLIYKEKK